MLELGLVFSYNRLMGNEDSRSATAARSWLGFVRYYGFFLLHAVILVAWYLSPLYLSWWYVALSVAVYYLQNWVFGGCVLSVLQFKRSDRGFFAHYLAKLGLPLGEHFLGFLGHAIPASLIIFALAR